MKIGVRKDPIYVLPHGIEVIAEYPPNNHIPYWRVLIRPHQFFPGVRAISDGCTVHRSRAVLASTLGRPLSPGEHAHHIDEDRCNDSPSNIELLTAAEHNRHHKTGSRHRDDSKAKTSATLKAAYESGAKIASRTIGSKQKSAKLTEDQASFIKHSTAKTGELIEMFGVSRTVVKRIRNGKLWRHVP